VAGRQRRPEHVGCGAGQQSALGPGEILVRVQACDLSHGDPALSTGDMSQPFAHGARSICGLDAAGTVIATGEGVARFAVGDEVFGHFPAGSWAWIEALCVRAADGPHVELRPEGLGPLAAAAVAHSGLTAKTMLRAARLRPGQTALVIGTTSQTATMLLSLLAATGAHLLDSATDTTEDTTEHTAGDPDVDTFTSDPDVDLLVDLVGFGEPYFITAAAGHGAIVSAVPGPDGPGVPRIAISAEPGDLPALAQRALDERQPIDIAHVHALEGSGTHRRPTPTRPAQPTIALRG
jgi:NADPH:quinone reductase-like Zn-dependent oxidoreductase